MVNLSPGPSQIYFTVQDHLKKAFRDGVPSLSHRSVEFEKIFAETTDGLRSLLNIPEDHFIVFVSSATEIWERSLQNLVLEKSFHLVNGAFSKKFHETARQLKKNAGIQDVPSGKAFPQATVYEEAELIAVTQNETSSGVALPLPFIYSIKEKNPGSLVIVDAVSSLPYPDFSYDKIDSVFFSVQKGFGLPAGLGVWVLNPRCVEKANSLHARGEVIGTYHSIPSLVKFAEKNQTPETPNVLSIYLLGKVVGDFLQRGISKIRKETEYKAAVLYQALEKADGISPWVAEPILRSQTVIVAATGTHTELLSKYLQGHGFFPGSGYGEHQQDHLRFGNFPAHSKEQMENLADLIAKYH